MLLLVANISSLLKPCYTSCVSKLNEIILSNNLIYIQSINQTCVFLANSLVFNVIIISSYLGSSSRFLISS